MSQAQALPLRPQTTARHRLRDLSPDRLSPALTNLPALPCSAALIKTVPVTEAARNPRREALVRGQRSLGPRGSLRTGPPPSCGPALELSPAKWYEPGDQRGARPRGQ